MEAQNVCRAARGNGISTGVPVLTNDVDLDYFRWGFWFVCLFFCVILTVRVLGQVLLSVFVHPPHPTPLFFFF